MAFYRGPGGTGTGSVTTLPVQVSEGGTGATTAANARTNLGLSTMALQSSTNVSITGGTVTGVTGVVNSVNMTVPTGLSVSGGPITSTGTFAVTFASGYSIPTTSAQSNWDTAYGWGDHSVAGYLTSAAIGVTVQGYDADTAKYDDATANFVGTLQNGGSNVLVDTDIGVAVQAYDATILKSADIGVTVQGYDADTAKYDDVTANFSGTLQNGGNTVLTTVSTISGGTY